MACEKGRILADSLPDWLSIGVAVTAVIVSVFSLRDARASRRKADELEERQRKDAAARAARQIDVYWGHDRLAPGHTESFAVIVRNRSDESVYDFRAETEALPHTRALPMDVVPPGWWRARFHPLDESKPLGFGYVKPVRPEEFSLVSDKEHHIREYSFTDASGRRWRSVGGAPPELIERV